MSPLFLTSGPVIRGCTVASNTRFTLKSAPRPPLSYPFAYLPLPPRSFAHVHFATLVTLSTPFIQPLSVLKAQCRANCRSEGLIFFLLQNFSRTECLLRTPQDISLTDCQS